MVYYKEQSIDNAFFALSHPVRRQVVERLAKGGLSVGEVSRTIDESPSQMTKHFHILERAGLISRKKEGRVHHLRFEHEPLDEMMRWVIQHRKLWEGRLDALENYLNELSEEK